ncbi:hypothetical protein Alches_23300 [Alicyclobacillus hesperidum subsp. aegles]|uniref:hypothetical protein n=1 Tax=Alicyclobacillus hesperidum TaxID=89784 RepID=UPI00222B8C21|nr:hypothetical protein [Alicyclobacillus hesperidum]GLG02289.1 hypothetical protein Alches_23300 [Alicyclobacillus hesperidum subsp. aegles]
MNDHVGIEEWETQFSNALTQRSVTGMIDALESPATTHVGTANAQVERNAIKTIERHFESEPDALFLTALEMYRSSNPTAEEVGAQLLALCHEV